MSTSTALWNTAYKEREDLNQFGSAGLALFAMALKFGYDDLETIGADAVVDGPDDKGCDVVYIDRDQKVAIISQSYRADTPKISAQDSKAASLRQAISYLIEVEIEKVPERIRASASALRAAISDAEIDQIHIWFVHNCPASTNVAAEMSAVGHTAKSALVSRFKSKDITIFSEEISTEYLEKMYTDTNTPILVNDVIEFDTAPGLSFNEGEWN